MTAAPNDSHTTFKKELGLIPRFGWGIVALVLLAWYGLAIPRIIATVPAHAHRWGGGPERISIAIVMSFAGLLFGLWATLILYVNADAKRRQMSRVAWTLIVLFIPYGIGFVVYFVARRPIPQSCPQCHALVGMDFLFCPSCRYELRSRCPQCQHHIETGWANCAYCGARLG